MKGIIAKIESDKYTVLVSFHENGIEKNIMMRVLDYDVSKLRVGMDVEFNNNEKELYGRVICRVINR
ncbi:MULTISPECIES: hypothetical protein [Aeromonas]|uniref:Translation initiation factor IF-1 n=1 Tax=Aeromonas bestiarum TaxID=105751 RepID=A0ABT7Q1P1_9GAMM|nr:MULTISPECIES: hypothetical protein [Aeromonas]MCH7349051.1 hypothetical protein [Aeromonas sp. MR7]MDM5073234.1 hypothetical protein [Aeromonas bestiarum]